MSIGGTIRCRTINVALGRRIVIFVANTLTITRTTKMKKQLREREREREFYLSFLPMSVATFLRGTSTRIAKHSTI
jgi:hypothetical protein